MLSTQYGVVGPDRKECVFNGFGGAGKEAEESQGGGHCGRVATGSGLDDLEGPPHDEPAEKGSFVGDAR